MFYILCPTQFFLPDFFNSGGVFNNRDQQAKNFNKGLIMRSFHREFLALSLISLVIAARLMPHLPNFTPIISIALFSGSMLQSKWRAFSVPLFGLFISNMSLGFDVSALVSTFLILGITGLGIFMTKSSNNRSNKEVTSWPLYSGLAASSFFILSNFSVWLTSGLYSMTLSGLGECYLMGLPFFRNTLGSTLLYSGILFIGHKILNGLANKYLKQSQGFAK